MSLHEPSEQQDPSGREQAHTRRIACERELDAAFATAIAAFELATASLPTEREVRPSADPALAECDGFQG